MSGEIELVSDGDGIAVFGPTSEVELFLSSAGVSSVEISSNRLIGSILSTGADAMQLGAGVAANSGRWIKLTEDSAKALHLAKVLNQGKAMTGSSSGVSRAILTTNGGEISKILEFVDPSILTNPAFLTGVAGVMAQMAMKQTMQEITQYLADIDEKVDDVKRSQTDAEVSKMVGVGLAIDDAMLKLDHVGRVSDVTWSSLHGAAQTLAATQSYALRRLDGMASKLEKKRKVVGLEKAAKDAKKEVAEWLAVLARSFQLQDALAIMELERVLDSSPEELDDHREAIQAGRAKRRELIAGTTQRLLVRMDNAADVANTKVLLHPFSAKAVVHAGNAVGKSIAEFNSRLGIEQGRDDLEAKRWREAVSEARDTVVQTVTVFDEVTDRVTAEAFASVKGFTRDVAGGVSERLTRSRNESGKAEKAVQAALLDANEADGS